MNCLVIGGDSKLSKKLIPLLENNKIKYKFTSRKKNRSKNSIFLDLSNTDKFKIPKNINCALIIGGVTNYDTCLN
jgi:dTDP-4-dehydrorhamnose reductase